MERSVVSEIYPQFLRDAKDIMPVSDGFYDLITDPRCKGSRAFYVAKEISISMPLGL